MLDRLQKTFNVAAIQLAQCSSAYFLKKSPQSCEAEQIEGQQAESYPIMVHDNW